MSQRQRRINGRSAGQGHRFDIDGNLVELFVAGDVDRDGDLDGDDPNAFWLSYGLCSGQGGYNPYADMDGDNCVGLGDYSLLASYLGNEAIWVDLAYDGENRLVRYEPQTHVASEQLVTYTYDYLGRRIERKVFDWDVGDPNTAEDDDWAGTPTEHTKFVWSGWLLLLELDGLSDDAVLRKYTWGLDLAGRNGGHSMESAGGIGGLLGVFETQGTSDPNDDKSYVFNYDGNGNVSELIDISDGSIAAHYEYDAFGRELVATGPYAAVNHFRFSTKWRDPLTGLLDYGRRWYDPRTGRWINRDPLEEAGGLNLYAIVGNEPTGRVDPLGLQDAQRRVPVVDPFRRGIHIKSHESYTLEQLEAKLVSQAHAEDAYRDSLVGRAEAFAQSCKSEITVPSHLQANILGLQMFAANFGILGHPENALQNTELGAEAYTAEARTEISLGVAQGMINVVQGVQDSLIGLVNMVVETGESLPPVIAVERSLGTELDVPSIPSPDWARDLIVPTDDLTYDASRVIGSEAALFLTGMTASRAAGAACATQKGAPALDDLSRAAGAADRNGLTKAGRALQKHSDRPGSAFVYPGSRSPVSLNSGSSRISGMR